MNEQRSFASLTGKLLARKGTARPAMRSPLNLRGSSGSLTSGGMSAAVADDLGWNDIHGEEALDEEHSAPVVPPPPTIVELQEAISARLAMVANRHVGKPSEQTAKQAAPVAPVAVVDAPMVQPAEEPTGPSRRSALANGRRAAFTLRLDAERHLKLRLACTMQNRSAQMLITEALDRLFADEPALAVLAAQMPSRS